MNFWHTCTLPRRVGLRFTRGPEPQVKRLGGAACAPDSQVKRALSIQTISHSVFVFNHLASFGLVSRTFRPFSCVFVRSRACSVCPGATGETPREGPRHLWPRATGEFTHPPPGRGEMCLTDPGRARRLPPPRPSIKTPPGTPLGLRAI